MEVQEQAADRIGRAAAVVEERGERRVAKRDVTSCRNAERRSRNGVKRQARDGRSRRRAPRTVPRPAAGPRRSRRARARSGRDAASRVRGRRVTLVGDVVGSAREPVDRDHRRPLRTWQQERRDRKVLVMGGRHGALKCGIDDGENRWREGSTFTRCGLWRAAPASAIIARSANAAARERNGRRKGPRRAARRAPRKRPRASPVGKRRGPQ